MNGDLAVVVPVKTLAQAKQRLAPVLDAEQRAGLYRCMLEDVLAALAASSAHAGVVVVTADAQAAALATRHGARVLEDHACAGQSAAVALAAHALAAEGCAGLLTVPGDVPLLSPLEIDAVLAAHGAGPALTIVPARDDYGSNALACSPPGLMPFHFGDDSFRLHLAEARQIGVQARVLRLPGLALDIDRPADLAEFARAPSATRSYAWLVEHGLTGLASRVAGPAACDGPAPG